MNEIKLEYELEIIITTQSQNKFSKVCTSKQKTENWRLVYELSEEEILVEKGGVK